MRSRVASVLGCSLFALLLAACHGHGEGFETLADCYQVHHEDENLSVQQAIVVCCLDHPIEGVNPSCGETAAECVTHVTAELDDVVAADIETSCSTYIEEKQASSPGPRVSPSANLSASPSAG